VLLPDVFREEDGVVFREEPYSDMENAVGDEKRRGNIDGVVQVSEKDDCSEIDR